MSAIPGKNTLKQQNKVFSTHPSLTFSYFFQYRYLAFLLDSQELLYNIHDVIVQISRHRGEVGGM
jgi:hypothetical protein